MKLSVFTRVLEDLIFPSSCVSCGRANVLLCGYCLQTILKPKTTRPLHGPIRSIVSVIKYRDELTKTLISRFKYQGEVALAAWFAPVLVTALKDQVTLKSPVVLVPVPGDFWRRFERGYNQTEVLARHVAKLTGWPVATALKKRYPTPSQTELSKHEKQVNLKGAFLWRGTTLRGVTVIIVDDVMTSGATLREAARAIARAHPAATYGLVLAV